MLCVSRDLVGEFHEFRDLLNALPGADVAVVSDAVRGEAGAEQRPVAAVDARRIAHQHIGDVEAVLNGEIHGVQLSGVVLNGASCAFREIISARRLMEAVLL